MVGNGECRRLGGVRCAGARPSGAGRELRRCSEPGNARQLVTYWSGSWKYASSAAVALRASEGRVAGLEEYIKVGKMRGVGAAVRAVQSRPADRPVLADRRARKLAPLPGLAQRAARRQRATANVPVSGRSRDDGPTRTS